MLLVILMFIGGCAGSTAGGLKVSRVMMMFKGVKRDLKRMIHPRSVNSVRLEGKTLDNSTLNLVNSYIVIYAIIFIGVMLILSFDSFNIETTFTAITSCINNIGPAFGEIGPLGSFDAFSTLSKWALSFTMLLGRLEIFPILLTFSPSTWARK